MLGAQLPVIITDWYLCMFTTSFPTSLALRVLDVVFSEGDLMHVTPSECVLSVVDACFLHNNRSGCTCGVLHTLNCVILSMFCYDFCSVERSTGSQILHRLTIALISLHEKDILAQSGENRHSIV